jgi:hypothetical protein
MTYRHCFLETLLKGCEPLELQVNLAIIACQLSLVANVIRSIVVRSTDLLRRQVL